MCCGPLPGCLIHIKAPAIIYIMSLPPPPAAPLPPSPPPQPYVRVHVCLHARAGLHSCTDRQALTQTVTHNDMQQHKNSQSSHIRIETKVHLICRPLACTHRHDRAQVLNDDVCGHTTVCFCFPCLSPTHPRNCSVSFSSPHSRLIFF